MESKNDLEQLKSLLFGSEREALDSITERVRGRESRTDDVADVLPEAIRLSYQKNNGLARSLRQPVGDCLGEAFHDQPEKYANALYPVMGPAIRKSIISTLRAFAQQINETIEQSLSLRGMKWRFDAWRTGVPFGQYVIQQTLLYRIEQAYLISRENGLLIGHVHHESSVIKDSDAVSAMFTAIQDFIKESFSPDRSGRLETADMGEFTLWAVHGPHALLVCVIRGVPPVTLRGDLSSILERVHFRNADALRDYAGDTDTVDGVEDELNECLRFEAMQPETKRSIARWPVLLLSAVILAGLAYWAVQSWRSEQRATALQQVIARTPGWYVSDVESDDGVLRITGLRDPLADSLVTVIETAGLTEDQVVASLQPFQSLDPAIVRLRSIDALALPDGVRVLPDDAGLSLTGTAPYSWLAATRDRLTAGAIPSNVDLSAVSAREWAALQTEAETYRDTSFRFDNGAEFLAADAAGIDEFVSRLADFSTRVSAVGGTLTVSIVGYTDAIGTPERNVAVAEGRVDAARSKLLDAGINAEWISTTLEVDTGSAQTMEPEKRRVGVDVTDIRFP
ncbi:MAG: hypothetical protein AAGA44_13700 [Pseudomonadota bacterium]